MAEKSKPDRGENGHEVGVVVSVPLWISRPWNNLAAAKEHVLETKAGSQERMNEVKKMIQMEYIESETHLTLAREYEQKILPPAEANVKLTLESHASGKTDFLHLTQAVQTWIDVSIRYQNELYHAVEHKTLLERWLGEEIDNEK
jgi:hypothetical protein